jgi:hypothetical protein
MRRLLLLTVLALAALAPSLAPAGSLKARVWLADRSPLVVRGSGFVPAERVSVTVTGAGRFVRTVTATRSGTIVARWTSVPAKEGCATLFIRAVGTRSTVVTAKVPGIECPQPPADPGS